MNQQPDIALEPLAWAERLRAWQQILRLGNVFTAVSNVLAGYLLVHREWPSGGAEMGQFLALVVSSALLYAAGMALNDAFDAEVDAAERPDRPIPSGRIARKTAFAAGWLLLAGGAAIPVALSVLQMLTNPSLVATCLALTVAMYDGGLKKTWAGPWAMGWCRLLNVLLGASASAELATTPVVWRFALSVGLYTVGLSYIARDEAAAPGKQVAQAPHWLAAAALAGAMVVAWTMLNDFALAVPRYAWGTLVLMFFGVVAAAWSYSRTGPRQRIRAIVGLLRGFIALDALAALAAAGWGAAALVMALLAPTVLASRRAPMT